MYLTTTETTKFPELIWTSAKNNLAITSIIVTSYSTDRLPYLKQLIDSVNNQKDNLKAEVVFVIESDRVLFDRLVLALRDLPLFAKVIYFDRLEGMSDARNRGVLSCSGEYIAFVDDDVVLNKDYLQTLILMMETSDAIALTGPLVPIWDENRASWFPKELSWLIGSSEWLDSNTVRNLRNAWGSNYVTRKKEFLDIGGFSQDFGLHNASRYKWSDPPSEDVDLSIRLSKEFHKPILFVPKLRVGHHVTARKISWKFIAQRSYSIGYQRHSMQKFYMNEGNAKLFSLEMALIPNILSLWPRTLVSLFRSPKKAMNTFAALFIVLIFASLGFVDRRRY